MITRSDIIHHVRSQSHVVLWRVEDGVGILFRPRNDDLAILRLREDAKEVVRKIAQEIRRPAVIVRGIHGLAGLVSALGEERTYYCSGCGEFHDADASVDAAIRKEFAMRLMDQMFEVAGTVLREREWRH